MIQSFSRRCDLLKIAVQGGPADARIIRELLSPWDVSFTCFDDAELVIIYKEKPPEKKKVIVIPSESEGFTKWIEDMKLAVVRKPGKPVSVAAGAQTVLNITPQILYNHSKLVRSAPWSKLPTATEIEKNLVLLTLDIIGEYNKILSTTLNTQPSRIYRLLTSSPVPYGMAPRPLRNLLMKANRGQQNLTYCDKLPVDALRLILVKAIKILLGSEPTRKSWNGKKYACVLTHDVDSREALQRTNRLRKLEEKYDVPSVWYIPSKRYKLNVETIRELANYGEVGAHGTRHDGKLDRLSEQKLVDRMREAKQTLEKITDSPVRGFRTPLLQHNFKILQAVNKAGYAYDSSIPTWEPRHPASMQPHGIGTIYPLDMDGIIEIPVSLPQDHQMIHVLGVNARDAVRKWSEIKEVIKELGGLCTLLVHPDYALAELSNIFVYEELLNAIVSDSQAWVGVPAEIGWSASPVGG